MVLPLKMEKSCHNTNTNTTFKPKQISELIQSVFQKEIKSHLLLRTNLLSCKSQQMNQTCLNSLNSILMKKMLQLLHGKMMTKTPFQLAVLGLQDCLIFTILMLTLQQLLTSKSHQVLESSKTVESSKEESPKKWKFSNGTMPINNMKLQVPFPKQFMPLKSLWTKKINTLVLKLNKQLKFWHGKLML